MSIELLLRHIEVLQNRIDDLYYEHAEMKRQQANLMRPGTVKSFDAAKGLAICDVGFDTRPLRTLQFAGEFNSWHPMTAGQQIMLFSPSGDPGNGLVLPLGHSNANPAPSARGDEHVNLFGNLRQTYHKDLHGLSVGANGSGHYLKLNGAAVTKVADVSQIKFLIGQDTWMRLNPEALLPTDPENLT